MLYSENIKISANGLEFRDKHGNLLSTSVALTKAKNRIINWWLDSKLFFIHLISLHIPFWIIRKEVFVLAGLKIGRGSVIHMGCKFFEPKNIVIGEDTIVGDRAFLDGRASLRIGSHVDVASEVMIWNSEHDINDPNFEAKNADVLIEDYVFIGPRSVILPGVTINKGAIVAAGAVVTKNIPENSIYGGVPAIKIGERKLREFNYRLGRTRLFQ